MIAHVRYELHVVQHRLIGSLAHIQINAHSLTALPWDVNKRTVFLFSKQNLVQKLYYAYIHMYSLVYTVQHMQYYFSL